MRVAVIGGGVGGLTAATRLAILGHDVQLFEAREEVGGLASGFQRDGVWFDGGPYILLDRPGLEWALEQLGLDVSTLDLHPADDLYEVSPVRIFLDLERTVDALGSAGPAYRDFVMKMDAIRVKLAPLLRVSHPTIFDLARRGSLSVAPFLVRSLGGVLRHSGLPPDVMKAVTIWTHVAGQEIDSAPSVMAFIPALIHRVGAFVPAGGMRAIPEALAEYARRSGVAIYCGKRIRKIVTINSRVVAVDNVPCNAVVSNYHAIGTYDDLVEVPERIRRRLRAMPLQSPGLCAYVTASSGEGSYLRFRHNGGLQLRVRHQNTVRMIMPFDRHASDEQQSAALQRMLDDSWWREGLRDVRLVHSRTVRAWGRDMNLYRDSMNPVMTRRLMLHGRIAHRSPWVKGLYLAGASTHPGQWVSFCAISGILAADLLHADHAAVRFDDVNGKRLRYFRGGEGPTVVFLHGYPDNLQMWSGVIPRLPDFETIAFDWPGMGGSEAWVGGATPFAMADRLIALLDHWQVNRAALVAIDMGGQPAIIAAAQHPDRTSRIVVSGSLLQFDAPTSLDIRMLRKFRFNQFFLRHFPRTVFRRAVSSSISQLDDSVRQDFWEHFRRRDVRDFIVRLCAGYQGTLAKLPDHLPVPALCLWGEIDRHFPAIHAQRLRGATVQIIEGGEHWLPLQRPEEFAHHVRIALSNASRSSADAKK